MRKTTPKTARSARGGAATSVITTAQSVALVRGAHDENPHERRHARGNSLYRDHERQEFVPVAEHLTATAAAPWQCRQGESQTDRHDGHGRGRRGALNRLDQCAPEVVELHSQ